MSLLHVHRAERSDRLVDALAEALTDPLDDPLATEVVAVHSRGIERWIAQELSQRLGTGEGASDGVCANVTFPFPGRLIRAAVAAGSGIDPEHDPWLPERLTWPLLELAQEHPDPAMLGPLRTHLTDEDEAGGGGGPTRRFGAVRHIADLFDQYGVHRPQMLRSWARGEAVGPDGAPLRDRHRWQASYWGVVRRRIGLPSFAERHESALEAVARDPDLLDLPPRLVLFGLTALPASYLAVLTAIAQHRDVHLMLLHPSGSLWRRVEAAQQGRLRLLWTREEDPTAELPRNPLLGSWGRDARELQLVAPAPDDPERRHHHPAERDEPGSLLARIQADVHADRVPGADGAPLLDPGDRSLQVHDCHGRLRQVEVLRDAVLHLLADDASLEPRDIIVMCPEIETFAPLVTAVFGAEAVIHEGDDPDRGDPAADGGPPRLRVRLADRSLRRTNPLLETVAALLDLVDARLTASSVVDLLAREPVRRRLELTDEELELVEEWVAELQVRWGLDAEHRQRHGLPPLEANTWRAGLRRLQVGVAMADEDLRDVEGVVPYDGVEGQTSDLAGRLVEVIDRIGRALASMSGPHTVEGWRRAIGAAADALLLTAPDASWQRLQLHRVLDDLVEEAGGAGSASPVRLTLSEARSLLAQRLTGRPTTTSHRTGDLTVCTLVPMRSVPHRVICLLGLDDGAFPRQSVPDSDDLLLQAPRIGDRDLRSEDRQLLLDALLAAGETLVITYAGRDVRTNEERPPAVPVDELFDVVDRTVRTADGRRPRTHITRRHPLAAHDPGNFEPGSPQGARPWGFDPLTLAAAQARRAQQAPPPAFLRAPLTPLTEEVIDLDDLVSFLQHPVRAFVRQRLEVALPSEDERLSDAIPAALDGLTAWQVGQHMLAAWLAGDEDDAQRRLDRAQEVVRARGLVPPGDLALNELRTVRDRVERIIALCERLEIAPGPRRTVNVEVALPDGRRLAGAVPGVGGWRIESVSASKVAPKHRLAAWARLLSVAAGEPVAPWSAATVGRHPYRKGVAAQAVVIEPLHPDPERAAELATEQLVRLVDLFDRGRCAPAPLYCETSAQIAENLRRDDPPEEWLGRRWASSLWDHIEREDLDPYHLLVLGGQVGVEELLAEPVAADEAEWCDDDRRVVAHAWRLWEPLLDAERRCEA